MKTKFVLNLFATLFFSNFGYSQGFNGFAVFNPSGENTTYLIDKDGNIAHSWQCSMQGNYTVKLKDNGNIIRGAVDLSSPLIGAAAGGIVQELDPSANVVWEFNYSNSQHLSHHDLEVLPNGNVILIAWEVKTVQESTQCGYNGTPMSLWPTHFIELEPNGNGGASIVWEWHIWDHLIQDDDPSKDNYGVVADHPELMDVNAVDPWEPIWGGDWFHVNGINYNEDLDQLVFSSRTAKEFFIIDHSTTTAEAASHSGGNSGMGGDFLYRWGNPANYGSSALQTISGPVHDPRWIEDDGRTNGGRIQFFNNLGSNSNSTVDAIDTPASGFNYSFSGNAYAPSSHNWRHNCLANADGQSSSDVLSNGNIFVNVSGSYMYEINSNNTVVWQYNGGEYAYKVMRYECDSPGIISLLGEDPCGIASLSDEAIDELSIYPNPSNSGLFTIDGINVTDQKTVIKVIDMFGNSVLEQSNVQTIDLSEMSDGVYIATLLFGDKHIVTKKITIVR